MILDLNERLLKKSAEVEKWKLRRRRQVSLPVYTSVDLRNAGYKIASIDTNLYPAGFNNLCPVYNEECAISFKKYISAHYGKAKKILVIAEAHTRNEFYAENLRCFISMLEKDKYEVKAGLVAEGFNRDSIELEGLEGSVETWRVDRDGDVLRAGDFVPDIVINNNDFTQGVPKILRGVSQPIDPQPSLGWHMRRKSDHFAILEHMMEELGDILGMDPWLFYPFTQAVKGVDFHRRMGLERIASVIDQLIDEIRNKFNENDVSEKPFVFVKSDFGTYGMGVMTACSGEGFLSMRAKDRKKMRRGKGGVEINEVIVQEGIPTSDTHNDCPVEPVIYIVGGEPVGGFYRINCEKTIRENLNSRGMTFSKLCFHHLEEKKPDFLDAPACSDEVQMRVYGTIAAVCSIATGYEHKMLANG